MNAPVRSSRPAWCSGKSTGTNGLPGPQMMKAVYDMARKGARDEIQAQMRDGGLFSGGGR
ncbi:putative phage tail tape measure protein [Escherichia coli]|nr:putative phage tail tape measure protein [Escherichia coli]